MRLRLPAVAGRFYPGRPDPVAQPGGPFPGRSQRRGVGTSQGPDRPARRLCLFRTGGGIGILLPGSLVGPVRTRDLAGHLPYARCPRPCGHERRRVPDPAGKIPVDREAVDEALEFSQVTIDDDAQDRDHALEVQLPFLQVVLGEFAIVPFLVGNADARTVEEVLELLWNGDRTLIVVSSDLEPPESLRGSTDAGPGDCRSHRTTRRRCPWPEIRLWAKRHRRTLAGRQATRPDLPGPRSPLIRRHRRPTPARGRLRCLGFPRASRLIIVLPDRRI